jgi:hypothetical protein
MTAFHTLWFNPVKSHVDISGITACNTKSLNPVKIDYSPIKQIAVSGMVVTIDDQRGASLSAYPGWVIKEHFAQPDLRVILNSVYRQCGRSHPLHSQYMEAARRNREMVANGSLSAFFDDPLTLNASDVVRGLQMALTSTTHGANKLTNFERFCLRRRAAWDQQGSQDARTKRPAA